MIDATTIRSLSRHTPGYPPFLAQSGDEIDIVGMDGPRYVGWLYRKGEQPVRVSFVE